MKHANRFVCALLSCLMLLAACAPAASNDDEKDTGKDTAKDTKDTAVSDTADSTDDTSAEDTSSNLYTDNLPDTNFDGKTLNMFGDGRSSHNIVDNAGRGDDPDTTGNVMEEAMYKSRTEIENRFNCKIRYTEFTEDEVTSMYTNLVQTGDNTYQICMARDTLLSPMTTSGNLYNLSNISQFDFSQPWYANTTDSLAFGDIRFLGSSFLSYQLLQSCRVIAFNRGMWEDYNMELPYDKVFAGEWYLDDFVAAAKTVSQDVNSDGNWDDSDLYGFSTSNTELYCWQAAEEINFVLKDDDNMPYFSTEALEKGSVYLEKMSELYTLNYASTLFGFGHEMVGIGHALMCYCTLGRIMGAIVESSDIDYGYLPVPKLDENQEDYIFCTTDTYWTIPVSAVSTQEEKDFIGTVVEAYQCSNFNYVYPAYCEKALRYKSANHPEDSQVLDMIPDRLVLSFAYAYGYDSRTCNIVKDASAKNIASLVARAEKSLSATLTKDIASFQEVAGAQQ